MRPALNGKVKELGNADDIAEFISDFATDAEKLIKFAEEPELVDAWRVLKSSDLRKNIADLEIVKNYQIKADFDVSGLKEEFENSHNKRTFIDDLAKANKPWEESFKVFENLTYNDKKIPLKFPDDGCYYRAHIISEYLQKRYKVQRFLLWANQRKEEVFYIL